VLLPRSSTVEVAASAPAVHLWAQLALQLPRVHELLGAAAVFHADETSARVAGGRSLGALGLYRPVHLAGRVSQERGGGDGRAGGAAGAHLLRELAAVAEGSGVDLSSQVRSCP
jgi:hypothetical protein